MSFVDFLYIPVNFQAASLAHHLSLTAHSALNGEEKKKRTYGRNVHIEQAWEQRKRYSRFHSLDFLSVFPVAYSHLLQGTCALA